MSNPPPNALSTADTIAITMRVALEHHDRGQLQDAAALYREVLGMEPAHTESLFLLGLIEASAGNLRTGIELLRAAVCSQPKAVHMLRALAEALLNAGRAAAALHCYWRILPLDPGNAMAYVNVGDVMAAIKLDGGNDPAAARCYQRALAVDAGCASAHLGLGHIRLRAGDMGEAEREYRAAIAADGRQAGSHAALGQVLLRRCQYASAADAFRRAILLQPRSPEWLERLGDALCQLGQQVRAEACYRRAAQMGGSSETSHRMREGISAGAWQHWPTGTIPTAPRREVAVRSVSVSREGPISTKWEVQPVQ